MEVDSKNAKITSWNNDTREVTYQYNYMDYNALLLMRHKFKGGYCRNRVSPPRKPRTTGKNSQNTHVHGHAAQIAKYQGDSKNNVIEYAKCLAVERQELRPLTKDGKEIKNVFGMVRGISETEMDTIECAAVIERLHDIAGFLGIILREE